MHGYTRSILFPYGLRTRITAPPDGKPIAIFFGTDFYNLPAGSDLKAYATATNRMLHYMREKLPDHELLYLPHPNEKDEFSHLDLSGFEVRPHTIGELFMYENPERVRAVFSSCSWASGSAYAMGYRAGVFLHLLKGCIPDDAIAGYESYFHGFPNDFFIRSFDQDVPTAPSSDPRGEEEGAQRIVDAALPAQTVWFIVPEPAYGVRAAHLARLVQERGARVGMIQITYSRWSRVDEHDMFRPFDEVVKVPKIWYTARAWRLPALLSAIAIAGRVPVKKGDSIISFAHALIPENVILSRHKSVKQVLLLESRWHHFSYEHPYGGLPKEDFRTSLGVWLFTSLIEPLLGLHQTVYEEHQDGKVVNMWRYKKPLERIYDESFVLVPKL